jgi:hypothetical protein
MQYLKASLMANEIKVFLSLQDFRDFVYHNDNIIMRVSEKWQLTHEMMSYFRNQDIRSKKALSRLVQDGYLKFKRVRLGRVYSITEKTLAIYPELSFFVGKKANAEYQLKTKQIEERVKQELRGLVLKIVSGSYTDEDLTRHNVITSPGFMSQTENRL